MANLAGLIDHDAPPSIDFGAIPAGEYVAIIIDSDTKPTRNNDGQYLELTYKIIDGPLANRQVWARFNLANKDAQAVAIAQRNLAACRMACKLDRVDESEQLHNIPHVIRVDFTAAGTKRKNGTTVEKDSNEVRAWKALPEGYTAPALGAGAPAGAAAPASPFRPQTAAPAQAPPGVAAAPAPAAAAPAAPTWAGGGQAAA